jgi:hypothetical protein
VSSSTRLTEISGMRDAQLAVKELFTVLNVLLTLLPSVVMIAMQATTISAVITAYSTAVGPSSLVKKR